METLISECVCNHYNSSNLITISGGRLTLSNLTKELDPVLIHFVYSAPSGCQNRCNIRSIARAYKIYAQGKHSLFGMEKTPCTIARWPSSYTGLCLRVSIPQYVGFLQNITVYYASCVATGPPQNPVLIYNKMNQICFSSSSNYPTLYEVNITDITGSLALSNTYSTSQCLTTSALYPDECAPLTVSVTARNSFGELTTRQSFNTSKGVILHY